MNCSKNILQTNHSEFATGIWLWCKSLWIFPEISEVDKITLFTIQFIISFASFITSDRPARTLRNRKKLRLRCCPSERSSGGSGQSQGSRSQGYSRTFCSSLVDFFFVVFLIALNENLPYYRAISYWFEISISVRVRRIPLKFAEILLIS